jgi:para-aminobenzoate synthetase component I
LQQKLNTETRTDSRFPITDFTIVKQKMLTWANRFGIFCFLDNHQYPSEINSIECILAAGAKKMVSCTAGNALNTLQEFIDKEKGWLFGHMSYDLKNEIEPLTSAHTDHIKFPDLFFFRPEIVIRLSLTEMIIETGSGNEEEINKAITGISDTTDLLATSVINVQQRLNREEYIETVKKLQSHIVRGDCYEINFCQDFFAHNAVISPEQVYKKLSRISPNPFSALYRVNDKYLICASPERFLKKLGNKILSQPIKGTSKRVKENAEDDIKSKNDLFASAKDRSENVMVVDMVRNDLSKICDEGTVQADELYGVYSFPQVHQMISTVSGSLKKNISFKEIMTAVFPMGSMTGAPKRRVMELIEQYEKTKRGIFSGAVGYINPAGDFDFNVVIRSIMYNVSEKYLSFQAGSGITFYSDAGKEWEECLLKAEAIKQVLLPEN